MAYNAVEKVNNAIFKVVTKKRTAITDDLLFRLHYQFSSFIVLISVIMYSIVVHKMENISCIFPKKTGLGSDDNIKSICWVLSVYTLTSNLDTHTSIGTIAAELQPGVRGLHNVSESVRYHTYYHGVPFILLIQLMLFLAPWYLWHNCENGKMKMMSKDMKGCIISKDTKLKHIKMLGEYFMASLHHNNFYGYAFAFCELSNLISVCIQMFFLDYVTGYVFSSYGSEVLEFTLQPQTNRVDPMSKAFPVLGKCTFSTYGPGGNAVPHSGICALPLNLTSERYFVFMWFYLLMLATLDVFNVIFRMATIVSRKFRQHLLHRKAYFTRRHRVDEIMEDCQYGDWFILHLLADNFDGSTYFDLIEDIIERMEIRKNA